MTLGEEDSRPCIQFVSDGKRTDQTGSRDSDPRLTSPSFTFVLKLAILFHLRGPPPTPVAYVFANSAQFLAAHDHANKEMAHIQKH